jgi:N12 class adenine-specific DNA methylase
MKYPLRVEHMKRTLPAKGRSDTYNNLRPRLFDGSKLDFPGMNRTIHLRPHHSGILMPL